MSEELKSCPFCGGSVSLKSDGVLTSIVCETASRCRGSALIIAFPDSHKEAAVVAWNNRAAPAAQAVDETHAQMRMRHKREFDALCGDGFHYEECSCGTAGSYPDEIKWCACGKVFEARAALAAPVRAVKLPDRNDYEKHGVHEGCWCDTLDAVAQLNAQPDK